jgi:hypothetical protein
MNAPPTYIGGIRQAIETTVRRLKTTPPTGVGGVLQASPFLERASA